MTDQIKPKYCNHCRRNREISVIAVNVKSSRGTRTVPFGSVADVGRGGKLKLRDGVTVLAWFTWCIECWENYQVSNQKQIRNLQQEMVV